MDTPIQVDLGRVAQDLQIRRVQVESVVALLDEGNTVPFITRYRKERTGNLNEVVIREIEARVGRLRELAERKQTVLKAIEAQGKLSDELAAAIRAADNPKRLDDLYLPYKPKKKTKASEAREKGLEPLALRLWGRDATLTDLNAAAAELVDAEKGLDAAEKVLEGVGHILAELVNELAAVRDAVRRIVWRTGKIATTKADIPDGQGLEYRDYFDYSEPLAHIPPHRVLAINRGDKEGPLKVRLEVSRPELEAAFFAPLSLDGHPHSEFLRAAALDALDRLLLPSLEREARRDLTEVAERHAVDVFARNLRSLLLQPPIPKQVVLAIDPGFRTGCKVAVLGQDGNLLEHGVIHPHPPQSRRHEAKLFLKNLVGKHEVGVVAIGNGTACRETEELIAEIIAEGTYFTQNPHATQLDRVPVGTAAPAPAEAGSQSAPPGADAAAAVSAPPTPGETAAAPAEPTLPSPGGPAAPEPNGSAAAPPPEPVAHAPEPSPDQDATHAYVPEVAHHEPAEAPSPEGIPASEPATAEALPPISGGAPEQASQEAGPMSESPPTDPAGEQGVTDGAAESSSSHNSSHPYNGGDGGVAGQSPLAEGGSAEGMAAPAEAVAAQDSPPPLEGGAGRGSEIDALQSPPEEGGREGVAPAPEPTPAAPPEGQPAVTAASPEAAHAGAGHAEAGGTPAVEAPAAEAAAPAAGPAPAGRPAHGGRPEHPPRPPRPKMPPPPPKPHAADARLTQLAYVIVNEAGASVYSASPVGREEFPDYDATLRGTISIGRRLQDPLSELVKIEPQNIGVGLYQHDVSPKQLKESLEGVISHCVNFVGVDLNTASVPLLRHVSGLNQLTARRVADYRQEKGPFTDRAQLMQVEGVGPATFTQAAGFLKLRDGVNPLDRTWIHPESYPAATRLLERLGFTPEVVRDRDQLPALHAKLNELDVAALARELEVGEPTLRDICEALARPERDPRDDLPSPIFKKGVLKLEDLAAGMELKGTVLNVVDFGAFVDIGLKDSGLVHISQLANRYIKSPHDVVSVGDVVNVWVMGVDHERKRVSLTMVKPGTERPRGGPGGGGGRREGEPRGGRGGPRRAPGPGGPPRREGSAAAPAGTDAPRGPAPAGELPARRPDRPPGPRGPDGPGGGGPRPGHGPGGGHRGAPGRGGPRPPGPGGPGRYERAQAPRPPGRPAKPAPPPPPLSKDALTGNVPLRTFGQLKQLWQARTEDELPPPDAGAPPGPEAAEAPAPDAQPAPDPQPQPGDPTQENPS